MPCSFTALDWLRVESYLLFYPYDNSDMYPMEGQPIGDSLVVGKLEVDSTATQHPDLACAVAPKACASQ